MNPLKTASVGLTTFRSARPPASTLVAIAALALFVLPAASGCSKNSDSSSSAASSGTSASDAVVARINGAEIRQSDLQMAEDDLGENIHNMDPATKHEQLVAYVTDILLLAQAAEKKSLQNESEFKRRETFLHNKLLMGMMLQSLSKTAVSDDELHKVYDEAMTSMTGEEEVHARHILVETEDEAKAIIEQIKGGADFATLAKEKSKDPGGADGGDLGYFTKTQMVPEFAEVAFKMFPGQLSNPVKTQFGWHIIKVEDKRQKQAPPFEAVKPQIEAFVVRKAQNDLVGQLRQAAKVERLDKPAGQPAMPAPPAEQPKQ